MMNSVYPGRTQTGVDHQSNRSGKVWASFELGEEKAVATERAPPTEKAKFFFPVGAEPLFGDAPRPAKNDDHKEVFQ